ncbi:glycosyltransferase, MGT family [Asanoa hainanensis]|uniref:Glycosyltransferase, MGT family n=1 Tax=Asanoa hainanensis TaxID=560556 RepID=A0A239NK47_9ACTN|nr:glycosyltransferase [Asanoa hainanensis]SNT54972.1 glycosyltransferase, MGT family [Asanoa hainanensis]
MSKVVVCATPFQGHVTPVLTVAADLVRRGHEVVVYTGSRFADRVAATGARFAPLPPNADLDDRELDARYPVRATLPPGPARLSFDFETFFVGQLPAQLRGLRELLATFPADVVIGELGFWSIPALSLTEARADRPTLVTLGVVPLLFQDEEPPGFAYLQRFAEAILASVGASLDGFALSAPFRHTDHYLQLTVPGFEYPRDDLPPHIRFVGALPPHASGQFDEPSWWPELSTERPVVVVTQGTVARTDLTELVVPTVLALADQDVLVVAVTASADGPERVRRELGVVPDNLRLAGFVPFDRLLPRTDVLVTNGGYGGVQAALHHGVPLVVAGASEDKPEVAARVAWSGTGVDLRTGRPQPADLRVAVRTVLDDPGYYDRARIMAKEISRYDPFEAIAEIVAPR